MNKTLEKTLSGFRVLAADRSLLLQYILITTVALMAIIYTFINLHYSELQLVSHYTDFGTAHLYRDSWLYHSVFAVFFAVVASLHILIANKISNDISKSLAKYFVWLGIVIICLAWINAGLIINAWSPV